MIPFAGLNFAFRSADTVWTESGPQAGKIPGLVVLTQIARTSAEVLSAEDGVVIQFRPDGGRARYSLRLGALRQPPLPGPPGQEFPSMRNGHSITQNASWLHESHFSASVRMTAASCIHLLKRNETWH